MTSSYKTAKKTFLALIIVLSFGSLFVLNSPAKFTDPVYTGIEWANQPLCWVDDTHFVFLQQNKMNLPAEQAGPKGLYLVDLTKPASVQRLDLSPLPSSIHEEIGGVSCQDQNVLFYRFDSKTQATENYAVHLGSPPDLITKGRGWLVSVTGRYLLMSRSGQLKENAQGQDGRTNDCTPLFMKSGFTVHCWDFFLGQRWPLSTNVLAEYRWRDRFTVRDDDGTKRQIPNPATPLLGKDGKPILYALHLRDLTGKILVNLNEDPRYAPWVDYGLPITPDESYVYAACCERENPIGSAHIVCRYRLDSQPHDWEEVFRFDRVKQLKTTIVKLSVSQTGDVYFYIPAKASNGGIWRFDARSRSIDRIVSDSATHSNSEPSVSPDGKWMLYERSGRDGAKLMLLPTGAR